MIDMRRIFFFLLCLPVLAVSCNLNVVIGDDVEVMERRDFDSSATAIAVSMGFDVVLDSSVELGVVEVVTSQNIMEYVEVYVEDGTLHIGLAKDNSYHVDTLEARLSPALFRSFAVSGGSEIESYDLIDTTDDIAIAASGGSEVTLKGRCNGVAVAVSGGSDVDLEELEAQHVSAAVSGGSDLSVYAVKGLEVSATGGSEVEYKGEPIIKDFKTSGGSSIERN